jgi:hypothetical protein
MPWTLIFVACAGTFSTLSRSCYIFDFAYSAAAILTLIVALVILWPFKHPVVCQIIDNPSNTDTEPGFKPNPVTSVRIPIHITSLLSQWKSSGHTGNLLPVYVLVSCAYSMGFCSPGPSERVSITIQLSFSGPRALCPGERHCYLCWAHPPQCLDLIHPQASIQCVGNWTEQHETSQMSVLKEWVKNETK